jgi:hypothetical protein
LQPILDETEQIIVTQPEITAVEEVIENSKLVNPAVEVNNLLNDQKSNQLPDTVNLTNSDQII